MLRSEKTLHIGDLLILMMTIGMSRPVLGARFSEDTWVEQTQTGQVRGKMDEWKMIKPAQSQRTYVHQFPNEVGLEVLHIIDPDDTKFAMAIAMPIAGYSDELGSEGMANIVFNTLTDGTCANGEPFQTFAKHYKGGAKCTVGLSSTTYLMSLIKYNKDVTTCFLQNILNPKNLDGLANAKKKVKMSLKSQQRSWVNGEIMSAQAAESSPQAKVHWGTAEFVDKVSEATIYKWLDEHMSIGLMRLVVYGGGKEFDVTKLLKDIKTRWPKDPATPLPKDQPIAKNSWPGESMGLFMIRHNTDSEKHRTLRLQWIFEGRPDLASWKTHPTYTVCYVFDSDNKISLGEFLKANSLAHSLSCSTQKDPAHWRVQLSLKLTEKSDVDTVLHAVHYYIAEVLKDEPAFKLLMESVAKKSKISWELKDDEKGLSAVSGALGQFIDFPAELTLVARRTIRELDEPTVFNLISNMKQSNLNIMLDEINTDRFEAEKASGYERKELMTFGQEYWVGPNSRKKDLASTLEGSGTPSILSSYSDLPKTPTPLVSPPIQDSDYDGKEIETRDSKFADAYYGAYPELKKQDEGAELWVREGWVKSPSVSAQLYLNLEVVHDPGQERTVEEKACMAQYSGVLQEQFKSVFEDMALYPKTSFSWSKGSGGVYLSISTLKSLMEGIGAKITQTVLDKFVNVDQARWTKDLDQRKLNPLGRTTFHPKFEASDLKALVVRSEAYSEDEWLKAFNGLDFKNIEKDVTAYYKKYPMTLQGLAMGAIDEAQVEALFDRFASMRSPAAGKTAFQSVKKLKQPIEVRHSTASKADKNYDNNVADVTLFTGLQTLVDRVLDQLLSQYMNAWVKEHKDILDKHYTDEFGFTTSLAAFGGYVRSWTSYMMSTKSSVDDLELLLEVFHLHVLPRKLATLDTVDLKKKIDQWLASVSVKQLPSAQYSHFKYHLDLPAGAACFERLNKMHAVFATLSQYPEKAREMMLDRWLKVASSPQRKRLVVKVSRDLPDPSNRKSPQGSEALFNEIYKDKDLAKADKGPELLARLPIDDLNKAFSDGTAVISEPIDSTIRKKVQYYEEDYPITEFCNFEDSWAEEFRMKAEEENFSGSPRTSTSWLLRGVFLLSAVAFSLL